MTATLLRLTADRDLTAGWSGHPAPVPAQIGGVARASAPCPLRHRAL